MHTLHVCEIKMYEMSKTFTTTLPRQEGDLATIRQWQYTKMRPEQYGQHWANCILRSIILTSGKFEWNFIHVIFKETLVIDGWGISCEIALMWMSLAFTDDQSTLIQVMAWCRQATSHYLNQCWPRSLSPYDVTRHNELNESHCNLIKILLKCVHGSKIDNKSTLAHVVARCHT